MNSHGSETVAGSQRRCAMDVVFASVVSLLPQDLRTALTSVWFGRPRYPSGILRTHIETLRLQGFWAATYFSTPSSHLIVPTGSCSVAAPSPCLLSSLVFVCDSCRNASTGASGWQEWILAYLVVSRNDLHTRAQKVPRQLDCCVQSILPVLQRRGEGCYMKTRRGAGLRSLRRRPRRSSLLQQ